MTGDRNPHTDLRLEQAALHAMGLLDGDDLASFEAHRAGCVACQQEERTLTETATELAVGVAADPPASLRERVLAAVREASREPSVQAWKAWPTTTVPIGGFTHVPRDETAWQPTAVLGVEVRRLLVDEARDRVTMLVRMGAGTSYPPHRHGGLEECFVIEGDILAGQRRLGPGDYIAAHPGSVHETQSTVGGCLLFIVSSLRDEIIEGRA